VRKHYAARNPTPPQRRWMRRKKTMAKFVMGQAVRVVDWAHDPRSPPGWDRTPLIGTESYITEVDEWKGIPIYGTAHAPILRAKFIGLRAISAFVDDELEPVIDDQIKTEEHEQELEIA
jgi:hypothetical protein